MTRRPYQPELRSIPLTFMDCPYYDECPLAACDLILGAEAQYRKFGLTQPKHVPSILCQNNRDLGKCPENYR
jgi:hypothetical protein